MQTHYDQFIMYGYFNKQNYKCGRMPNVMAAQPNIGGALC